MKKLVPALALICAVQEAQAIQLTDDLSLTTTVTITSDFRSRGKSQTQNDPALQLDNMLYSNSTGLYAGVWTSNVDYGGDPADGNAYKVRYEIDYYAGWYWQINDNFSLDTGILKYTYPRNSSDNSSEYYTVLSAYGFSVAAQYSNDVPYNFAPFNGDKQSTLWTWIAYEHSLPWDVTGKVHYGKMDYKDDLIWDGKSARQSYNEWEIKFSKPWKGINWSVSYSDSDLDKTECFWSTGFKDTCGPAAVFSASKSF